LLVFIAVFSVTVLTLSVLLPGIDALRGMRITATSSKALHYQKGEDSPDTRQAFIAAHAPQPRRRWNLIAWVVDFKRRIALERLEKSGRPPVPGEDTLDRAPYLREFPDYYEIRLDLTGIYLDSVDYRLDRKNIIISGVWSLEDKAGKADGQKASRRSGPFFKILEVPPNADGYNLYIEQEGNELVAIMPKIYRDRLGHSR
jgi:hypothetical protein